MTTKTRDESDTRESRSVTIPIRNVHKRTTLLLTGTYHARLSAMGMIALTKSQVRATTQLRNSAMRIPALVMASAPAMEAVRDPVPPSVRSASPRVDSPQRYTPRAPMQSVEVMRERRGNSGSERPTAPQPSYSERAPSAPQQERTMMRQTQVDRGESHASQPAPRMAESQHSAPAESHVPPARDSGSNSNS